MKDTLRIVCLGHACIDRNTTEHAQYIGWGGVLYIASYFQKQSLQPQIITSYGPDLTEHVKDFDLLPTEPNMERTLVFENIVRPGERRVQYCHHVDMSLPPVLTPELKVAIAEADIVVMATFLPTYSAEWLEQALGFVKDSCLKVLCPQGYLRTVSVDGLVSSREFSEAEHVLPMFDMAFISDEDTPNALATAQDWKRFAPHTEIVVTNGPRGATIIEVDKPRLIPTTPIPPSKIVDSVGCGDVFAAAVSLDRSKGTPLDEAIKAGHRVAAEKLQTVTPH